VKTRAADPQHLAEEGDRWFALRLGDEAKRTHPISSRAQKAAAFSQDLLLFKPPDSLAELPELPELSRRHAVLAFSTDGHPHRVAGSYCDGLGGKRHGPADGSEL
jgi:hypothetical protein